ncbi:putative RNA recognition motif domain, nucleotide-binding alpha-beta plait domain superfamily [Helianthus annuus]|nr:putative RNA recognition motif domain, nucleotide-binding alpha-beta plait domain superfamily [Helianthus annuus]KAJ0487262.1 putative RNA recognition motif domain, nucleotide-binding alpha-beta plait domain superfamily [Helianthus annuus]KAJ0661372.1 putative RNA recognition motif domain, nucleotide-binding alpha-beta plait domain superfamily [Helianthus annuus]
MTMMSNNNTNAGVGPFGDTTLTKVFVGGLAWETPKEAMRDHFQNYGDILEAVIISDKTTGRSKGYGFVTFKEPESAKKACEDPTPIINGRRANCNLASLGARRQRTLTVVPPSPPPPPPYQQTGPNVIVGPRSAGAITPPRSHVQWYYPPTPPTPASPYHHHQHAVPYYGYAPATYVAATDVSYNHKLGYTGGAYMSGGHYSVMYPNQATVGAHTLMPMYPMYPYHQSQAMGLPAQFFCAPTSAGPMTAAPAIYSKPTQIAPTPSIYLILY